jgi:L-amino acid N-acyltransferase YncA
VSDSAVRRARPGDVVAIAEIHNEGVADRIATFRAEPRPLAEVEAVLASGRPLLVAEADGAVIGWAGLSPYDDASPWYTGIGEAAVYVARASRRSGAGRELLAALGDAAAAEGYYKLIAKIFDTNEPSLRLFERAGFRRVGTHLRHGRLDGEWRDVVVLEKLIGDAAG